jgi:hypothetical protein
MMHQKKIVPVLVVGIVGLSLLSCYAYNNYKKPAKNKGFPSIEPESDKEDEEKDKEDEEKDPEE